jgi:hypothetical protein
VYSLFFDFDKTSISLVTFTSGCHQEQATAFSRPDFLVGIYNIRIHSSPVF